MALFCILVLKYEVITYIFLRSLLVQPSCYTEQDFTAFFDVGIDFLSYIAAVMDKFRSTKRNDTDRENSE